MKLINTETLTLENFPDERSLEYAILSHRWEEEEVLFEHMWPDYDLVTVRRMKGFDKIERCCERARQAGIQYAWVDTCCIDKNSSAELQEAINSMFRWYSSAEVCYVFLSDVNLPDSDDNGQFRASKWFKRGWTLQELVAPKRLYFFDRLWSLMGSRMELASIMCEVTGIRLSVLQGGFPDKDEILIAEIMSWAKGRQTTRIEDRAYSLMGLFDVNMAMLYGEGEKSFRRLQEEIIKNSTDQSIFLWEGIEPGNTGLLAKSPDNFCFANPHFQRGREREEPHVVTSQGVSLPVRLVHWDPYTYLALLNVQSFMHGGCQYTHCVFLRRVVPEGCYARVRCDDRDLYMRSMHESLRSTTQSSILVLKQLNPGWNRMAYVLKPSSSFFDVVVSQPQDIPDRIVCKKVAAIWKATWDMDRTILRLKDTCFGFAGAIELIAPSSPSPSSTGVTLVVAFGFFDNFTPHCALLAIQRSSYALDLPYLRQLNREVMAISQWTKVFGANGVPNDESNNSHHLMQLRPGPKSTNYMYRRLWNGTILLRPQSSYDRRGLCSKWGSMDVTFSLRRHIKLVVSSLHDDNYDAEAGFKVFINCFPEDPTPATAQSEQQTVINLPRANR